MRIKFLCILISVILISCSMERDYEFKVYNKTNYKINSFKIEEDVEIAIEPNDSSEIITWHHDGTYFNFTEPLVALFIAEYSDSLNVFKNSIGQVFSIPDLNKKDVNRIEITLCDNCQIKDYIFDIEVNR